MKYYGIKWNKRKEKLEFLFAKISTKAKSVLPGKNRDLYKKNYKSVFKDDHYHSRRNNSLPESKLFMTGIYSNYMRSILA